MASPIKASFGSVHLWKLSLCKNKATYLLCYPRPIKLLYSIISTNDALIKCSLYFYGFFLGWYLDIILGQYPNRSVAVWYQIYQAINFFDVWLHWGIIKCYRCLINYACLQALVNNNAYMAKQLCYSKLQLKNMWNLFVQVCNLAISKLTM